MSEFTNRDHTLIAAQASVSVPSVKKFVETDQRMHPAICSAIVRAMKSLSYLVPAHRITA
jgi:DNA-binding LacI/PurR family transcriptional regulator